MLGHWEPWFWRQKGPARGFFLFGRAWASAWRFEKKKLYAWNADADAAAKSADADGDEEEKQGYVVADVVVSFLLI